MKNGHDPHLQSGHLAVRLRFELDEIVNFMQFSDVDLSVGSTSKYLELQTRIPRIAIVGAGFVGSTTAYALMMSGMAVDIALIDRDLRRAEGHVNDLRDAELFSHKTRVFVGDFSDCCSADITVITAGVSQAGQKSREEGMRETGAMVHGLVADVCREKPRGILLIASNPVDVMTYASWKWSGLPSERVIGSGTSLDASRFRRRLAERYGVASTNVHAYVIGARASLRRERIGQDCKRDAYCRGRHH